MPVPVQIANAAVSFRRNGGMLKRSFAGLAPEEWLKSPEAGSNHILWIAGHIIWARSATLKFLEAPAWSRPWLTDFERGKELEDATKYPSPEEMLSAFEEMDKALKEGLENATVEAMSATAPPNTPPGDGTVGGVVNFLAFHETYHVGQVGYLRCWLGHDGPQG